MTRAGTGDGRHGAPGAAPGGGLSPLDRERLREARRVLESPGGPVIRATTLLGRPIEGGLGRLPAGVRRLVADASRQALRRALDVAVSTLAGEPGTPARPGWHKAAAVASGVAGGAFGAAALALELPVSTTIMLRSIADIAREHGEDLADLEARLACLEVFALGGASADDDSAETGYYAARMALATLVADAVAALSGNAAAGIGARGVAGLVATIAARFQVQVSNKLIAQAAPGLGAAAGALLNAAFIDHFQSLARAHFTVRRLERVHGAELVRQEYVRMGAR